MNALPVRRCLEPELVELVKALAREAAREDHAREQRDSGDADAHHASG